MSAAKQGGPASEKPKSSRRLKLVSAHGEKLTDAEIVVLLRAENRQLKRRIREGVKQEVFNVKTLAGVAEVAVNAEKPKPFVEQMRAALEDANNNRPTVGALLVHSMTTIARANAGTFKTSLAGFVAAVVDDLSTDAEVLAAAFGDDAICAVDFSNAQYHHRSRLGALRTIAYQVISDLEAQVSK